MTPDELESSVLSGLRGSEDLQILTKRDVTANDFLTYRGVYEWIYEYIRVYGTLPNVTLLRNQFPDFQYMPVPDSLDYLASELKRVSVRREAKELLKNQIEKIDENTYEAIEAIASGLYALRPRDSLAMSLTDQSVVQRYNRYLTFKENIGVETIPTGWGFFDNRGAYWRRGEIVGFVARTFVGKSWSILQSSAVAWAAGYRVLFISPEIGIDEAERRFDTIVAHLLNFPIVLNDLRYGHQDSKENYFKVTEKLKERADFLTIDSINGRKVSPQRIHELALRFKPDVVAIDGVRYVDDDNRASAGWERILNVCTDLKTLSNILRFVTLTVQQVKPEVSPFRVPALEDVMYGDGFVQSMDRVVTLSFNEESSELRDMTVQKDRTSGEPLTSRINVEFKPGVGAMGEVRGF